MFFSIMGLMVAGAMTCEMVAVNIPIEIGVGESVQTISDLLNGILPGLPVLGLFGVVYWMLKKKVSPLLIMLIMLIMGIVGAFFGFSG